jgi:hypothetical protein
MGNLSGSTKSLTFDFEVSMTIFLSLLVLLRVENSLKID